MSKEIKLTPADDRLEALTPSFVIALVGGDILNVLISRKKS